VYHAFGPADVAEPEMTAEEFFASLNPEPVTPNPNGLNWLEGQYPDLIDELEGMTPHALWMHIQNEHGKAGNAPSAGGRLYPLEVSK
jgi:hypothetical protein